MRRAFNLKPGDEVIYLDNTKIVVTKVVENIKDKDRPSFKIGRYDLENGSFIVRGHTIFDNMDEAKRELVKRLEVDIQDINDKKNFYETLSRTYRNIIKKMGLNKEIKESEKKCIFCEEIDKDMVVYEDNTWIAFYDSYPVSNGHTLLVPKRHCESYFDLSDIEYATLGATIGVVKAILESKYKPDGFNIGANCGKAAGQTIPHCHIHIIPRYNGDMDDPKGGVRGVIPGKMKY